MTIGGIDLVDWATLAAALVATVTALVICFYLQSVAEECIQNARLIRAWRKRIGKYADYPFHWRWLTAFEQQWLNADGQTSEQWTRACAADLIAGRRSSMPTCGDYLAKFGRRPKVRPAETRTPVRN